VNDFNPGIDKTTGLFWTVAVPDDSVDVSPGSGRARFALTDFHTRDFHNIGNSVFGGSSDPAVVSFAMTWSGQGDRVVQTDGSTFTFDSVVSSVSIEWSAVNETTGMHFRSETSESEFAAVGHEKNGRFF
jgi:hypothetical protein